VNNKIKQLCLTVIVVMILFITGCRNQHVKDKQAATQRWDNSRVQLALDIATRQFRAGQLDKAAHTIYDALEINADYAPAHLLLGRVYMEQNRRSVAHQEFQRCLQINPNDAEANYNIAVLYEISKDYGKALTHYKKAHSLDDRNTAYLLAVTDILVIQNQHDQALDLLAEQMKNGQYNPSVYMASGNILSAIGRTHEAVSMFRRASNLSPDNLDITESLAFAFLADDNVGEAKTLFEQLKNRADDGEPVSLSCYLALGDCYLRLGRFHKAHQCFEQVRDLDSSNPAVWVRLAQAAIGRKDIVKARKYLERALELDPDDPLAEKLIESIKKDQTIANMPSVSGN